MTEMWTGITWENHIIKLDINFLLRTCETCAIFRDLWSRFPHNLMNKEGFNGFFPI